MNAHTTIAKPRGRLKPKPDEAPAPAIEEQPAPAIAGGIVPSSPEPIPLRLLRRAAENVRHTRIAEDVEQLADDIEAHGLLQSLIGYRDPFQPTCVEIVGGGRRLQALRSLRDRALINDDFPVPVLIRDQDDAVELSLAENLQQRTMSPVDEFLAFKALMDRGTNSPAILAKRFGFSERVVKQRLRLAELEPEVLDALAAREITIDAAMAYAGSQDRDLQREVFKAEKKKSGSYSHAHRPDDIRYALKRKGATTEHQLYRFVGAESYEHRGGGYEDDLFLDSGDAGKVLAHPHILQQAARELIDFQMIGKMREFQERDDLAPTITGYVITNDLKVDNYGNGAVVPKGLERIEKWDLSKVWKTIRNNGIDAQVVVGIDHKGELVAWKGAVLVPKAQRAALDPPTEQPGVQRSLTPEERDAAEREREIAKWARRLAVGPFAGTAFEGRAFWPQSYHGDNSRPTVQDGVPGRMIPVEIFVSDAAIAAQMAAAEAEVDAERREKLVAQQRVDQLTALDPPAIVVVDGLPWERGDDGTYAPIDELEDGYFSSWTNLVANLEPNELGETFATREAFDQTMAGAIAADEVSA